MLKSKVVILKTQNDTILNLIESINLKKIGIKVIEEQKELRKYIREHKDIIIIFEMSEISLETERIFIEFLNYIIPIGLCFEDYYILYAKQKQFFYFDETDEEEKADLVYILEKIVKNLGIRKLRKEREFNIGLAFYYLMINKIKSDVSKNVVNRLNLNPEESIQFETIIDYFIDFEEKRVQLLNKKFNIEQLFNLFNDIEKNYDIEINNNIGNLYNKVILENRNKNLINIKNINDENEFVYIIKQIINEINEKYLKKL